METIMEITRESQVRGAEEGEEVAVGSEVASPAGEEASEGATGEDFVEPPGEEDIEAPGPGEGEDSGEAGEGGAWVAPVEKAMLKPNYSRSGVTSFSLFLNTRAPNPKFHQPLIGKLLEVLFSS